MAELLHGTALSVAGRAVLIRGPSGAGKSDLALRCLAMPPGPLLTEPARLIADDQVLAARHGSRVLLRAPDKIRGLIEVRGIGVITLPSIAEAELVLAIDLVPPGTLERMPQPKPPAVIAGISVPSIDLDAFQSSAPLKLLLALERTRDRHQTSTP